MNPGTACNAAQWTIDGAALTPDNWGCSATDLHTIPLLRYGATTNATMTVTGLSTAIVTTQGGQPATVCVADQQYLESAHVVSVESFSGGTQTITVALRYPHGGPNVGGGFYVSQGSHTCNGV